MLSVASRNRKNPGFLPPRLSLNSPKLGAYSVEKGFIEIQTVV